MTTDIHQAGPRAVAGASRAARLATALVTVCLGLGLIGLPVARANDKPDDPRQERAAVRGQRAAVASQLDALQASDAQIDDALRTLDENIRGEQALVTDAQNEAADARRDADAAEIAASAKAAEVTGLESRMATVAVDSYVNPPGEGLLDRFRAENAQASAEKRALLDARVGRTTDLVDELRAAKHDLEQERQRADAARAHAEDRQQAAEAHLADLAGAKAEQQNLADGLEGRLESKLSESAALASHDKELSNQIAADQATLAVQLRRIAPPPPSPGPGGGAGQGPSSPPPVVVRGPAPVPLSTVRGITVNSSIAGQLGAMIDAAAADGVRLGGSGYRDPSQQIALRRAHCGTSDYAVYEMPASQCSPPTARPGTSNHERGLAIDFTYAGASISSQSNPGYVWLAANAARFGFFNLPSEPWHWSVDGR